MDPSGNLYIADSGHRRVIELTTAGTASVVQTPGQTIGTLLFGVTPDANGNIFVVDWSNNRVLRVNRSASALSFASTQVGSTSSDSPKMATVTNLGNEALVFSAASAYTADFSENSSDTNLCTSTTSLQPGEVCDISVLFTPLSAGSLSAGVVITNNHLNGSHNGSHVTQSVAVSGNAGKGTRLQPIRHWWRATSCWRQAWLRPSARQPARWRSTMAQACSVPAHWLPAPPGTRSQA